MAYNTFKVFEALRLHTSRRQCQRKTRRYINLMVTMLVGGLWHGANWTLSCGVVCMGMYLVINHGWRKFRRNQRETIIYEWAARVFTMLAVVFAWVFFRAESFLPPN